MRVVTYNIHRCVGTDDALDVGRVAEVLERLGPDVVALQEVDTSLDARFELGQLEVLARRTGLDAVLGPTVERSGGFYGNAILTRYEPRRVRRHDLSVEGREPRGAIDVELVVDGHSLRVVATHLGLTGAERRQQVGRLLGLLYAQPRGRAAVVMGDFNEWFRFSRNLRRLNSYLGWQPRHPTFPSRRPVFALDRIWAVPSGVLAEAGVADFDLAAKASDHLPRWADIVL